MEVLECSVSIYNFSKVLPVMYLAPDNRLPSPIPSMISIIFNSNGNAAGKCNTILFYYTTVVSLSLCSSVCVKSVHSPYITCKPEKLFHTAKPVYMS